MPFLQLPFQFAECGKLAALEFPDPPLADLMDRHRIEIMQLLAAMPERGDEAGRLENCKVLCDGLPRHGEAVAEFVQGLTVFGVKPVQQRPPRSIGQRFEDLIHGGDNRQPNGCMSRACFSEFHAAWYLVVSQRRLVSTAWGEKNEPLRQTGTVCLDIFYRIRHLRLRPARSDRRAAPSL